ncbi:hypothetical protein LG326_01865 [Metaplanococcus flavidus]
MLKKNMLLRVSMLAFVLMISSLFVPQANTEASVNNCGIYSIEEYSSYNLDEGEITIQCGGVRTVWEGILQGAVKTNQTSRVNNYEKSGGTNQALYDFQRMPGDAQEGAEGRLLKHYNGGTLAYYPSTSYEGVPTLSFPSSDRIRTDKVRYL